MALVLYRGLPPQLKVLGKVFSSDASTSNGVIYDKQPVKVRLEAGKTYWWCLCGRSSNQPFCDGTHKKPALNIKQQPVKFEVKETKEYFLCLCRQTSKSKRPFCDGTHKTPAVQNAISLVEQLKKNEFNINKLLYFAQSDFLFQEFL